MQVYTFDQIFLSCVTGKRARALTTDEVKLNAFLRACSKYYRVYANYGILHQYIDTAESMGWDKDFLLDLYNSKLSRLNAAAREYYELLKGFSVDNKCGLCHVSNAESLDHFLPKEHFPSLTIAPDNLIPSCDKCNRKKLEYFSTVNHMQLIHPRFEGFYNDFWLSAKFDQNENRIIVHPNKEIHPEGTVNYLRIAKHISRLGIQSAYEINAMREVRKIVRATRLDNTLTLEMAIRKEMQTLQANYEEYNEVKFTIDLYKWITCKALLNSQYFLQNGAEVFANAPVLNKPNYTFQ